MKTTSQNRGMTLKQVHKLMVRRFGIGSGYYELKDGRYVTLNAQRGFVEVPLTSRSLQYDLAHS